MAAVGFVSRKLELLHHPDLSRCLAAFPAPSELRRVHALVVTSGLSSDAFTVARLLASCAVPSSGDLHHARALFASIERPTPFMYNTMFRALSRSPRPVDSIHLYSRMLRSGIWPDRLTFPFLIRSCSVLGSRGLGQGVHCHAVKHGLDSDVFVVNNAITMYSDWGDMVSARKLFDEHVDVADVVSWTALVTGYSNCRQLDCARWLFDQMPERNPISWNAMVAGYAKEGNTMEALQLFDKMPDRNLASWSSIISGFAQSGRCKEALTVFREMVVRNVTPNESALVSAVSACAQLRDLNQGEWLHKYIMEHMVEMSIILGTALVDMYGKCGSVTKAIAVFNVMPEKNVYTWNSLIAGMAMNGSEMPALALFWKMQLTGLEPNAITFIGLLSACSHAGLISEGQQFFDTMTRVYRIRPLEEHYGCMVDLLGRAGLFKEALEFVETMPVEPHPGLWGALAGACRIHGNVELGEKVGKQLIDLEPHHGGRYVLLANLYGAARRWDDMSMVRKLLKQRKAAKFPGKSQVEPVQAN
ncbi:pentatricopeptide repeat-containing protein At5g66520-like [Zingiber officinale]|uniref:Pentatricopeptide repeat-containing protein n=1 Tax=Zingiber officinale TaxID=94328 RepID=A0A8J5L9B2_ZINOF|nr:pentatricopeptide repeat-containing protein At5g66520-like [Zingiber officinale]KAG6509606.1 hypothetical protein ZIOFF_027606 [Zingiber officinale]